MIDSIEDITIVTDSSNDIYVIKSLSSSWFVLHTFDEPSSLDRVREIDHTFIDVEDSSLRVHQLNILWSSILSLQLRVRTVVKMRDWSQLSVWNINFTSQVSSDHWLTQVEMHLFHYDLFYVWNLDRFVGLLYKIFDFITSSFMQLLKFMSRLIFSECFISILYIKFLYL